MIRNLGSLSYYVRYVQTKEFPEQEFPLVYFSDGTMSYSLTLFIKHLYKMNKAKSHALSTLFLVCGELHEFYKSATDTELANWNRNPSLMIVEYQNERINGTILNSECKRNLWWAPLHKDIVKKRLLAFIKFENFTKLYLKTVDFKLEDYLGVYTKNLSDQNFNLLSHLGINSESIVERSTQQSVNFKYNYKHDSSVAPITKFFPPNKIMQLIDEETNVNYKAIMLLCAFTGLRQSEPLHIFINDLLALNSGPQVLFSHPLLDTTIDIETGDLINRSKYLESFHGQAFLKSGLDKEEIAYLEKPVPRLDLVGRKKRFNLAFKGVTLSTGIQYGNYAGLYTLQWTLLAAEKEFVKLIPALLMQSRRNHPYLFCKENGAPLSKGAFEKKFKRKTGLGTHTLRHFAGMFCANALHLTKEQAQILLRHKLRTSTDVYYQSTHEKARKQLIGSTEDTTWEKLLKTLNKNWGLSE
jgi:integrase